MKSRSQEIKVGLFFLIGVALVVALLANFSQGLSWFQPRFHLNLLTSDVGAIRPKGAVLMAGVGVGRVETVELAPDGKNAIIRISILRKYAIRKDAVFSIQALGVLGDQFIAVRNGTDQAPLFQDGEEARCQEPFNFNEIIRASSGFIQRMDQTVERLHGTIGRLDRGLLSDQNLVQLTATITNLRSLTEKGLLALENLDRTVQTNSAPLASTLTNLARFSAELDAIGDELGLLVKSNRPGIETSVKNLESASLHLKQVMENVQSGKGMAGALVSDEQMKLDLSHTISNLSVLSSNLNRFGLLYKPKPKPASVNNPRYTGKDTMRP